jgi:oligoribonuclease
MSGVLALKDIALSSPVTFCLTSLVKEDQMTAQDPLNLIWIDLEMTGLDPERERIIEIATVVTDANLNVLAEGPSLVVHQQDTLLDAMDEWNRNQHGGSGLTQLVRNSQISEAQASAATIDFLRQWVPAGASPMCGNSIGQDRRFLVRYMPELAAFFHYRNLDVSTLKELVRRWKPELENGFVKKGSHLAMDDVYDSIAELAYYRKVFIQA